MQQDVYKDIWGSLAVKAETKLFNQIVGNKSFRALQKEAEELGLNFMSAAQATAEQLAYFVGMKKGIIAKVESDEARK